MLVFSITTVYLASDLEGGSDEKYMGKVFVIWLVHNCNCNAFHFKKYCVCFPPSLRQCSLGEEMKRLSYLEVRGYRGNYFLSGSARRRRLRGRWATVCDTRDMVHRADCGQVGGTSGPTCSPWTTAPLALLYQRLCHRTAAQPHLVWLSSG